MTIRPIAIILEGVATVGGVLALMALMSGGTAFGSMVLGAVAGL